MDLILTELICHNTDDALLNKIIEKFSNLQVVHQQNISNHQQKIINHFKSQLKTETVILHVLKKSIKNRKTSKGVAQFLASHWLPHLVQLGSNMGIQSPELQEGFRLLKNLILLMPPSKPNGTYTPSSWLKDVKSHIENVHGEWQEVQPAVKALMGEYHECIRSRSVHLVDNALVFIDPLKIQPPETNENAHQTLSVPAHHAWENIQKIQHQQTFRLEQAEDLGQHKHPPTPYSHQQTVDIQFVWSDHPLQHFLFVDSTQQTPIVFNRKELIQAFEEKRIVPTQKAPQASIDKTVQFTILGELYLEHFYQCSQEHMMPLSHFQWKAAALINHPCLSPWWHALCVINTVTAQTKNTQVQKNGLSIENLSNAIRLTVKSLSLVNNTSFVGLVHLGEGLYGTLWQKMKSQDLETLLRDMLSTLKTQHEVQATAGLVYFDDDKEPVQEYLKKARYACMSIDPQTISFLKVYTPAKFAVERQCQLRESAQEQFSDQLQNSTLLLRGQKLCLSSFNENNGEQQPTDNTLSLALLVQPYFLTPSLPSQSTSKARG